jgi:hypothetical protein
MKLGTRNIEWFFIAGLAMITIAEYLIFSGGMVNNNAGTALTNMLLLMIVAGELLLGILMIKIYQKL